MNVNKSITPVVVIILIAGTVFFLTRQQEGPAPTTTLSPSPGGAQHVIIKTEASFGPANLKIRAGDTVVFQNQSGKAMWPASNLHPTHTLYPEFDALKSFDPGQEYSFTFTKKGTWPYHDHSDPTDGAVIIVE